jgi:amino-acid N-acetyltransferase
MIMTSKSYVNLFRESAPYIHAHRGKTFVIALTGEAVDGPNRFSLLADIAVLHSIGVRIILVHGARPQIDKRLSEAGFRSTFQDDIRISDSTMMPYIEEAIGSTRLQLEKLLSMGLPNPPMFGAQIRTVSGNFTIAKPVGIRNGIDHLFCGEVRRIDKGAIESALDSGSVVIIPPIGFSSTGEVFNLSYQDLASEVASFMKAEKLIFISSLDGIYIDGELQKRLSLTTLAKLIACDKVQSGLERKILQSAYKCCSNQVARVHLITEKSDGAILSELFTREGTGTLISEDKSETIRQAKIEDIGGLLELIQPLEQRGILVKRSRERLEVEIAKFYVSIHPEGFMVGCAALYPLNDNMGEIACVATHPDFTKQGTASRLLTVIEERAKQKSISSLFVLTTHAAHWFIEKGFTECGPDLLPEDKKLLYNYKRNSKVLSKKMDLQFAM